MGGQGAYERTSIDVYTIYYAGIDIYTIFLQ